MTCLRPYRSHISSLLLMCFSLIAFDQMIFHLLHDFVYTYSEMASVENHEQLHISGVDHSHGGIDLLQQDRDNTSENTIDQEVEQQIKVLPSSINYHYLIADYNSKQYYNSVLFPIWVYEINSPPPKMQFV